MDCFQKLVYKKFKIEAFDKNKNPLLSFFNLKYNYDYPDICYIVDNLGESNATFNKIIYGCSIPKSIAELGDTKILSGESNDEFEKEINWSILAIRKYCTELNHFISLKNKYEKSFMLGDYDSASGLLDLIENEVCYSLWGIEQRFLLLDIQKGLKENTSYLNDINKENTKWFIKYFSHFFSVKSEKELSVNQYNLSLSRFLLKYLENDNHVDSAYYNFKLNFLQDKALSYLPKFLAFESYHSIIDRYLALIRIFQLEINNNEKDKKEFIDSRLFYLSKKLNDDSIDRLRLIQGAELEWSFNPNSSDLEAIKILDFYTDGKFEQVEILLRNFLREHPLSIELYVVFVKSIIIQNKQLVFIGDNQESFQNKILLCLYDVLIKEKDISGSLIELRKIAYNLSSIFSISYFLVDMYNSEVENSKTFEYLSIINSSFLNPPILEHIKSKVNNNEILRKIGKSSTIDYLDFRKTNQITDITSSNLPSFRKKVLTASFYQRNQNYQQAIIEWQAILCYDNIKNFQVVEAIQNLYFCKLSLGDYDYCIDLYVDTYFKNPSLVRNIDVAELKKQVKKQRYKSVTYSINLPLFYKLTDSVDYEIHTAYECFLLENDVELPSEYISNLESPNIKHLFFLDSICTLDIFKHSPFIVSTNQKLNERITVCQFLMANDDKNKEEYRIEKERLTKKQIIQKGLQEIDESKIYVNEVGIIESELKNFKSIFNRYRALAELKTEKEISFIDLHSEKVLSFQYGENDKELENAISKDPQFDIFKDMFYYIQDKFLFSKYGLQQYLSARIRHGVFIGEIRPEFELLNLITEKEKGGENYKNNRYWKYLTKNEKQENADKFQQSLSDFSRNVDSLISDEILSKYLQIKTIEQNEEGWLDYIFNESQLYIFYAKYFRDVTDFNKLVEFTFLLLWQKTHNNLEHIRSQITSDIKAKFYDLLTKLEVNITSSLGFLPQDIGNNINESRVKIENKLSKIARWFTITDSNISDFKFSKAIDVGYECVQNSYTEKVLKLDINDECTCLIKGTYFPSFVDLLRIFLENIMQHSGFDVGVISTSIKITETEHMLNVTLISPIEQGVDLDKLNEKIGSVKLDLGKSMEEKNSGFHKALRILKSDLNNDENEMILSISESNTFNVELLINTKELIDESITN